MEAVLQGGPTHKEESLYRKMYCTGELLDMGISVCVLV